MVFVTVFRHVPRPITGMIGTVHDRTFETFEADLDWLQTTGILVEPGDGSSRSVQASRRDSAEQG